MCVPLPDTIVIGPNQRLYVTEKKLPKGSLGCIDLDVPEIIIETEQHQVGKHNILLHEMTHLAIEKMKQGGLIKRKPSEDFVTYLTGTLFPMLAMSGLWNGVTPEEAEEFMASNEE